MIVVVMGVAGAGKTTIGTMLADVLRCSFLDADALHSDTSVDAMEGGRPLTDADRAPWLAAIHSRLHDAFYRGDSLVVACSALKQSYRDVLSRGVAIVWVYLTGDADLIRSRLKARRGHFMTSNMLPAQLAALEEPTDAIVADVSAPPDAIVARILIALRERPDIRVLADLGTMSLRAAEAAVDLVSDAIRRTGRCSIALSGGSTPIPFHRLLATRFRDRISWRHVHVFWGDERYVPHDDPQSNYGMARRTLLDHVECPDENIHPMPTHFTDADEAARDYQNTLERYWAGGTPRFDLVVLGMGPDGHTASLFPGSPATHERTRLVVAATGPAEPRLRLTLTFPALARSAHAHFLVDGEDKRPVLSQVLAGRADPDVYPAAGVRPSNGETTWWLTLESVLFK
jgi:6-phosphogluconolactonase